MHNNMKKWVIIRRFSQAFFLILFIYILWSTTYPLNGAFHPTAFFQLDPLIILITSLSERVVLEGIGVSFLMILLALILGRFFCGWICPLGTTSDIGQGFRKRFSVKEGINNKLKLGKFFILGIIFIFAVFGIQLAWIFDPIVIMARFVSLNLIPAVTLVLNQIFILLIKGFGFSESLYDFYRALRASILGVKIFYFSHSALIFMSFMIIICAPLFLKRFWCRAICPLGALYAVVSKFSLLRRRIYKCTKCGICKSECRMGAIREDMSYDQSECVLCMDCVYDCPQHATSFGWVSPDLNEVKRPVYFFDFFINFYIRL
jgi:polyferredoxin